MDNAHVSSPREKMTYVWISGAAPYMGWGFFLVLPFAPRHFSLKGYSQFQSSKTNILKSQFILKIPGLFIVIDLNLLHVTNQNKDHDKWSLMADGWLWQSRHGGSFVSWGACSFLCTSTWSLNILQIILNKHCSLYKANRMIRPWVKQSLTKGKLCHPKSDWDHLWRVVIYERFRLCKGFDWKNLVFWICCGLWEVVSYMRWSNMKVQLYVLL